MEIKGKYRYLSWTNNEMYSIKKCNRRGLQPLRLYSSVIC